VRVFHGCPCNQRRGGDSILPPTVDDFSVFVLEPAEGFSEGALDLALHCVDLVTSHAFSPLHFGIIQTPYLGGLGLGIFVIISPVQVHRGLLVAATIRIGKLRRLRRLRLNLNLPSPIVDLGGHYVHPVIRPPICPRPVIPHVSNKGVFDQHRSDFGSPRNAGGFRFFSVLVAQVDATNEGRDE